MPASPLAPTTHSATGVDVDGQKLLRGMKRNSGLLIALTILTFAVSALITALQPYQYEAQSTLVKEQQSGESELKSLASQFSGVMLPGMEVGGTNLLTEMEVIRSRTVLGQAVDAEHLQIAVRDLTRERTLGRRISQKIQEVLGLTPAAPIEDLQNLPRALSFSDSAVPETVFKEKWILERTGDAQFAITDARTHQALGEGRLDEPFVANGIGFTLHDIAIPLNGRCELKFRSREGAIRDLFETIDIRRVRDRADLLAIAWQDTSPVQAKYVVNSVTDAYIAQSLAWKSELGQATDGLLAGQISQRQQEFANAQDALNAFKAQSDTVMISREAEGLFTQLGEVRLKLATQEIDTSQLGFALERLMKAGDREFLIFLNNTTAAGPAQALLVTELADLISKRDGMLTSRTNEHPEVLRLSAQINAKKSQILTLVDEAYRTARQRQGLLSGQANELDAHRQSLPETEATYARLQGDVQLASQLLVALKQRKQSNEISQLAASAPMRILDSAIAPLRQSAPRWPLQLALGALIGLVLGLVSATARTLLDTTIRQRSQAETLGLPVVAQIPKISEHSALPRGSAMPRLWLAIRQDPLGPVAEAFRILRSATTMANPGYQGRILGITSSGIGEGKSLVTLNLATMIAQAGLRTLVIDADLRRPAVARSFGLPVSPGLVEVLEGRTNLPEALRESGIANLWLLPAGDRTSRPSELLQGDALPRLLQTLRKEGEGPTATGGRSAPFDVILLDLPPISAVSETLALGRLTTALYLLIRAGQTPIEIARDALDRLEIAKVAVRGLILNDVSREDMGRLAQYYYHNYAEAPDVADRGLWERLTGQRPRTPAGK